MRDDYPQPERLVITWRSADKVLVLQDISYIKLKFIKKFLHVLQNTRKLSYWQSKVPLYIAAKLHMWFISLYLKSHI
jgi:hypothetical protein